MTDPKHYFQITEGVIPPRPKPYGWRCVCGAGELDTYSTERQAAVAGLKHERDEEWVAGIKDAHDAYVKATR